jgi:outer membrane murein-binding lipoprotein Lpp
MTDYKMLNTDLTITDPNARKTSFDLNVYSVILVQGNIEPTQHVDISTIAVNELAQDTNELAQDTNELAQDTNELAQDKKYVVQTANQRSQAVRKSTGKARRSKTNTFKGLHSKGILKRYETSFRRRCRNPFQVQKTNEETGPDNVKSN